MLNTLRFHWRKLPNHRGFFYHWANINTGERLWDSEVSSIDTAILLCGILTCRGAFRALRNQRAGLRYLQSRGLGLAIGRYFAPASRVEAGKRLPAISLGQLQRNDDDVSAGPRVRSPTRLPARVGMPGNERHSNMTAFAISARLRRSSFISIPRPGLTSGASTTNIRTISGTR